MRIDYSDPKKSCSSPQPSQSRPRKEPSGVGLFWVFITGVICLGVGFGGGWMVSQRSAKNAFRKALEQDSIESSQKQSKNQPSSVQQQTAPPAAATASQQAQPGATAGPVPIGTPPATADVPLSFYKTLPSGQKNNVMGSGINTREDKPAKQPLQAAIPANVTKPAVSPQPDENAQKQPVPAASAKPAARTDASGLTVQVASYSLKSEAETLRNKLAGKGYNVNIVESHQGDKGIWYRVRVGKRLDPDAAKELAGKLGKGAIAIPDKE